MILLSAIAFSILLAASFFLSLRIYRASAKASAVDRLLSALVPPVMVTGAFLFIYKTGMMIYDEQNWIRLERTFALAYGFPIYPALNSGVITTNIYGPVSAWAYLPAVLFKTPHAILIAGVSVSLFLYLAPLAWMLFSESRRRETSPDTAFFFLLFCSFAFAGTFLTSLKNAMFTVHADAPALGFSALACAFLYLRTPSKRLFHFFGAALCAVLSVWAKQVALPILIVLPLYILLAEGLAACLIFVAFEIVTGLAVSAIIFKIFENQELILNMFTVPGLHPVKDPFWKGWGKGVLKLGREILLFSAFAGIAAVPLVAARRDSWIEFFRRNRWLLFFMTGILMSPLALMSFRKIGGSNNTLSFAGYFFLIGAVLSFVEARRVKPLRDTGWVRTVPGIAVAAFSVFLLIAGIATDYYRIFRVHREPDYVQEAYEYAKANPGKSYFPRITLVHLLAEGKLYHSSDGVVDRLWAGHPLTREHFNAGIPADLEYVGFYRGGENHWDLLPFNQDDYLWVGPVPGLTHFWLYRRKPKS